MGFDAANDLKTLLNDPTKGFDYTNVSGLTANPTIRLFTDTLPTSFPTNGELIIDNEKLTNLENFINQRNEESNLICILSYNGNRSTILSMLDEIDRVFRENNKSSLSSRNYFIKLSSFLWFEKLAPIKQIEITIAMTKELVQL